jgi:hypothetical protein
MALNGKRKALAAFGGVLALMAAACGSGSDPIVGKWTDGKAGIEFSADGSCKPAMPGTQTSVCRWLRMGGGRYMITTEGGDGNDMTGFLYIVGSTMIVPTKHHQRLVFTKTH